MLRLRMRAPRLGRLLHVSERRRRNAILQHRVRRRRPTTATVIVPDKRPTAGDVEIAERLLAAYAHATADAPVDARPVDQWTFVYAQQSRFVELLTGGDPPALAAYLCNVSRHDAANGLLQGTYEFERITGDAAYRRWIGLSLRDRLVSLAEAVGATDVENPEEGKLGASLREDPAWLVSRIEQRLGIDVVPPDVDGALLKLETGRGRFGERDLWGIFTAHLLTRTLAERASSNGGGPARICEIGGGSGRAAYWAQRMGLSGYTIVDLPHVNVVQGYYLLKTLPHERVLLYGEDGADVRTTRVRVLPDHAIATGEHNYDLVLNQDSFPELSATVVDGYLSWIKRACAEGLLLSVNHESRAPYGRYDQRLVHLSVPEAVERSGGFELRQRYPCWLRRGYVVELYRVRSSVATSRLAPHA